MLANEKGATMAELVMVMTLLALFGVTICTLIYSGANTQRRIIDEKNAQSNARIALSYINVRLRQNDVSGKISVLRLGESGNNAILIKESEYDMWIFSDNGKLMECFVEPGQTPNTDSSFEIIENERFETTFNQRDGTITNTIFYTYDGMIKNMSSTIYLRSS